MTGDIGMDRQQVSQSEVLNKGLKGLVVPMLGEWLILLSIPFADTFFLSRVSNEAAAGVSLVTPLILGLYVLVEAMCIGGAAVAGQKMGAGNPDECNRCFSVLLILVVCMLVPMSGFLLLFGENIVDLMNLPSAVAKEATTYLSITGISLFAWGMMAVYKSVLNVYGFPSWNLIATCLMTLVNIALNSIVVFGILGFPRLGTAGVAFASVIAAFLSLAALMAVVRYRFSIRIHQFIVWKEFKILAKKICKVGVPSSFEPLSFQSSMLVISILLAGLAIDEITVRVYANSIFSFCLVIGIAFAIATQTIIAQHVGAGSYREAKIQLCQSLNIAIMLVFALSALFVLSSGYTVPFLAQDQKIYVSIMAVFLFYMVAEIPRTTNIIVAGALKSAGDALYISVGSVLITWAFSVPLAFYLVQGVGLGLYGILIAMLLDEAIRSVFNLRRWYQFKWVPADKRDEFKQRDRKPEHSEVGAAQL